MGRQQRILLLACYEMGHQPLSLAWPTAVFREAGFSVVARDLAVESLIAEEVAAATLVAIAVPMHTAMRLGVEVALRARSINAQAHICFYGLYGWLNADYLLESANGRQPIANSVVSGEVEQPLLTLAQYLQAEQSLNDIPGVSTTTHRSQPYRQRLTLPVPDRRDLPALGNYAHYMTADSSAIAGYVETSRGCLHTCSHCPVTPIYNGRFFIMQADNILADIRQQVAAGARHITFGDPDFLNGPKHALNIARAMHAEFPELTFDFTTKVEHILEKRELFPELRQLGASFVISAFEALSEKVLRRLDKGHTVPDMEEALTVLADANIPVQPTWVAFTPWTTLTDYLEMLDWVRQHKLIAHIPAVQYSIRLLIPPNSAILKQEDIQRWIGPLEADNFGYCWQHADPRMDVLQQRIARCAETAVDDPYLTFYQIEQMVCETAGIPQPARQASPIFDPIPPRLTEDWFC